MSSSVLLVYLSGRLAATVERSSSKALSLRYEQDYVYSTLPPLSLSLPKQEEPHTGEWIEHWLRSHLPEDNRILSVYARAGQVAAQNTIGMLATPLGADCAGAIQFASPDNSESVTERPSSLEPLSEAQMISELASVMSDDSKLQASDLYCSLAGYHRKLALCWHEGRWHKPVGAAPSTHILKPRQKLAKIAPVTEHVMLSTARHLGLEAPNSWLEQYADMTVLVVERYDRWLDNDTWRRVHQEDICQAMGLPPNAKLERNGGPTVITIAELLSNVTADPNRNLAKFASGLLYAWLRADIDSHARNYSIFYASSRPDLAPLYDLNTSLPFKKHPISDLHLAMSYAGDSQIGVLDTRAPFGRMGQELQLPAEQLRETASRLGSLFGDAVRDQVRNLDRTYSKSVRSELNRTVSNADRRSKLFSRF